eukprot:snap_masked-scaffold_26-processed-gene-2.15-mRNA-1 protein AED:1.00 eAED:1.00 QI:0/-1/0/0/-1/1/1/0/154
MQQHHNLTSKSKAANKEREICKPKKVIAQNIIHWKTERFKSSSRNTEDIPGTEKLRENMNFKKHMSFARRHTNWFKIDENMYQSATGEVHICDPNCLHWIATPCGTKLCAISGNVVEQGAYQRPLNDQAKLKRPNSSCGEFDRTAQRIKISDYN